MSDPLARYLHDHLAGACMQLRRESNARPTVRNTLGRFCRHALPEGIRDEHMVKKLDS